MWVNIPVPWILWEGSLNYPFGREWHTINVWYISSGWRTEGTIVVFFGGRFAGCMKHAFRCVFCWTVLIHWYILTYIGKVHHHSSPFVSTFTWRGLQYFMQPWCHGNMCFFSFLCTLIKKQTCRCFHPGMKTHLHIVFHDIEVFDKRVFVHFSHGMWEKLPLGDRRNLRAKLQTWASWPSSWRVCFWSLPSCFQAREIGSWCMEQKRVCPCRHGCQVSHEKNLGCLEYIGDYTTQLYWKYNKPL